MDYTTITDAVVFTAVLTAIGAVAAAKAAPLVAKMGARIILSFIK